MCQLDQYDFSDKVNRILALTEIELHLIKVLESLLNDSLYTDENVAKEIIHILSKINVEKDYLCNFIKQEDE